MLVSCSFISRARLFGKTSVPESNGHICTHRSYASLMASGSKPERLCRGGYYVSGNGILQSSNRPSPLFEKHKMCWPRRRKVHSVSKSCHKQGMIFSPVNVCFPVAVSRGCPCQVPVLSLVTVERAVLSMSKARGTNPFMVRTGVNPLRKLRYSVTRGQQSGSSSCAMPKQAPCRRRGVEIKHLFRVPFVKVKAF